MKLIYTVIILFIFSTNSLLFSNTKNISNIFSNKLSANSKMLFLEVQSEINHNINNYYSNLKSLNTKENQLNLSKIQKISFDNKFEDLNTQLKNIDKYLKFEQSNSELNNSFSNKFNYLFKSKNNVNYINGLIKLNDKINPKILSELENMGIIIKSKFSTILSVTIPLNNLYSSLINEKIKQFEIFSNDAPDLLRSRKEAGVDSLNAGFDNIPALSGKNVVVGVIDWGFDFTHPNFWNKDYTKSRINKAWDQYKYNADFGYKPDYGYGVVYDNQEALVGAIADTAGEHGILSHGSHTAGIAGGSGIDSALQHTKGVAHNSDLIMITRESGPAAFADAVDFISKHADSVGKPFVINMSFGGHNGPHDGSSLQNQIIDEASGEGKIFIGSAGNNGNDNCHLQHILNNDTLKSFVGFSFNTVDYYGQNIILWGEKNKDFKFRVNLADNSGFVFGNSDFFDTKENLAIDTFYVFNTDTLFLRVTTESRNALNEKCNANVVIAYKSKGYATIDVVNSTENNEENEIHLWNMIRQNKRLTNWGRPFFNIISSKVVEGYKTGNNDFTVGEPSGVGKRVISIGSFNVSTNSNGDILSNNISTFSSRGPTIDKRTKPDLAASGEFVRSSINSSDPAYNSGGGYTPGVSEFDYNGTKYRYATSSGTSMSGPMVAGTVALLLEFNPKLTPEELKYILQASTKQDNYTTFYDRMVPNNTWGTGKLNAIGAAVKTYELITSIDGYNSDDMITIYPNPFVNEIFINLKNQEIKTQNINSFEIFDINGNMMYKNLDIKNNNQIIISTENFQQGIYFLKINSQDVKKTYKFIK